MSSRQHGLTIFNYCPNQLEQLGSNQIGKIIMGEAFAERDNIEQTRLLSPVGG